MYKCAQVFVALLGSQKADLSLPRRIRRVQGKVQLYLKQSPDPGLLRIPADKAVKTPLIVNM